VNARTDVISSRIEIVLRALDAQPFLSVSQAAMMVGLSTSRLEHLFQAELGTSMRAYKQECKLQRACHLLRDRTLRIKEIRCLCGIPDASNFTRLFKQRFGVTPSAYRADGFERCSQQAADSANK
jgi:AraC-like DNA-binding protein